VTVALTIADGRIAPVFESAQILSIVRFEGERTRLFELPLAGPTGLEKAEAVRRQRVARLLTGGIPGGLRRLIEASGTEVVPWVTGDAGEWIRRLVARRDRALRIAVSSRERGPGSPVEPRFGRAAWFVFYEPDRDAWSAVENPMREAPGGAGARAARLVLDEGATVVLTGRVGPSAGGALRAGGVALELVDGAIATAADAISAWREQQLVTGRPAPEPRRAWEAPERRV
jgi:predicted Fe-Mo cluster-binding NifX family protein